MLQQTRVDAVVSYYERWLQRFPTVEALSRAEPDEVLKAWEGLGYYARARNLHAAARVVRERHAGILPSDPADLKHLPGIGEYTAGAIASIAFGVPAPAVDGNVRRVLARIYDLEEPTSGQLRRLAAALVPEDRPGDFNQALMELGATLCTPRSPDCQACPLAAFCQARALGAQERRPRPPAKRTVPERVIATAVVDDGTGRLLLVRRPPDGLLGGLWEFPGAEVPVDDDAVGLARAVAEAAVARARRADSTDRGARRSRRPGRARTGGESLVSVGAVADVPHAFSHFHALYRPYRFTLQAGPVPASGPARRASEEAGAAPDAPGRADGVGAPDGDIVWADAGTLAALPLAKAQRRIARAAAEAG